MNDNTTARRLDTVYAVEIDGVQEQEWHDTLSLFDDSTLYQTWSYGSVLYGRRHMGHMRLRHDGQIVAAAQVRFARVPILNAGVAYVLWGPMWRRRGNRPNADVLRQVLRALRNEYACKRGLLLRIAPLRFDRESEDLCPVFAEEGYLPAARTTARRTIIMDLSPSLEDLRSGLHRNWKRNLKASEQCQLTVIHGEDDELFETIVDIYRGMVSRKGFVEPNDIAKFRSVQVLLPDALKMKMFVCRSSEGPCAGLVWSEMGDAAIELFAATSPSALTNGAAYLLRWRLVDHLKQKGFRKYNLNGVNPEQNPGCYQFKNGLAAKNGTETSYLGLFEATGSVVSTWCVAIGEPFRARFRSMRNRITRSDSK